ncbi:cytochrome C [Melaminivora suipulveris]|uniref:Cytochrome C n=1 Tax=Melaminivora suipulveris TaxID=2109913 RepID=A0A2R3QE22_9BURK|nr:cytochrome c [Melaminivora suipulveris]AVO49924.1 cytochrome C [Melaminivora suipulveris]
MLLSILNVCRSAAGRAATRVAGWLRAAALLPLLCLPLAHAATLQLHGARGSAQLDGAALAAHPQARDIDVPQDVAYGRAMRYRAVPLALVLTELGLTRQDTLEAVASDGFTAQLPGALVLEGAAAGRSQPWLAIEPADAPWPALPGKAHSAGPFYLVWPHGEGVASEQWPYAIARLAVQQAPELRWPQIAVAPSLAPQHPARRGQAVFITQCLVCHAMNGGGGATMGPDLNRPLNPVQYFQDAALRRLIRDPKSVRAWPAQAMPGFSAQQISDAQLDDLLAYLAHMAGRR